MSLVQLQTKIPSVAFQQTLFVKLSEEANRFCRTRREAIFTGLNGMVLNPILLLAGGSILFCRMNILASGFAIRKNLRSSSFVAGQRYFSTFFYVLLR